MMRIVPKDEAEFKDNFIRHVKDFARDYGVNWETVNDSKEIENCSWAIAHRLWYIKKNVKQTDNDKMNTRESIEKFKKQMEEAEAAGKVSYSCGCGLKTANKKTFDDHDCKLRKGARRAYRK